MIKAVCSILFFLSCFAAISQDYSEHDPNQLYDHDLDENKWQKIRDNIRYEGHDDGVGRQWTYENDRAYNRAKKNAGNGKGGNGSGNGGNGTGGSGSGSTSKPQPPRSSSPPSSSSSSSSSSGLGGLGFMGYIFLILFLIAIMALIYFLFLNAPKKGKKIGESIILDEVNPTEIPLTELQKMLQEALANNDFRGAIRIYFIFILKDLAEKKWIQWEKEKTNFHYLREMAGKNEYDDFNRAVSYFEIIWYGKRELDQEKFNLIKPNFTRFLDKLGVK